MAKKPTYEELEKRVKELEKEALERKQAEDKEKQYICELEFLSKTATEFVELSLEENIYQFIGKKLTKLIGESIVIVNSFSEKSGRSCTRAILGLGKRTEAVIKILGADPVGKTFEVEDEGIRALTGGKLHKIPGGIYRLTPEIPKAAFRAIQKLLALGDAYSMGFSWGGKLFGNAVILLRQGCELGNQNIIETFMRQASVSLQRKGAEEALRKAHDELEMRVDERTAELVKTNERLKREIEERKRAEEALRESEQRFKEMADLLPTIISELDSYFNLTYVNQAAFETFGYSQDDFEGGLNAIDMIHPADRKRALRNIRKVMRGKRLDGNEYRMLRKNGSELTALIHSSPIYKNGRVVAIRGTLTNITKRKRMEEALREREVELEIKTNSLEEVNTALRVLLERRDEDKTEVEEKVLVNVKELVVPFLEKVKKSQLDPRQVAYIHILESNLNAIVSPFLRTLSAKYVRLTPTEIQVANLIKDGKATKEIAELFNLSSKTVNTHRQNIRMKLGLKNKKVNLRSHLLTLQQ